MCTKVLRAEYNSYENLPLKIEGKVLETSNFVADPDELEFKKSSYLNHLPHGATFGFVEIDL